MRLHVGTSGYNFPEWKGTFYPEKYPEAKMLAYYAERLGTVDVQTSCDPAVRENFNRATALLHSFAFRLAIGGAAERWGVRPDLAVLGKALANGFPLAVVGGRADLMDLVSRTWISSTLATEAVALAAAQATLAVFAAEDVCGHLHRVGTRLLHGLPVADLGVVLLVEGVEPRALLRLRQ